MKKIIVALLCLHAIPYMAKAQVVISDGAVLSITPTVIFYSGGDFTNNGKVLNNGSLNIAGAWTNTGDYEAEAGQVNFNGTTEQIINHNKQSFARLILSGGGQKIFKADITVNEELVLQDGILSTDNDSKIFLAENTKVTGGSANSFVQGGVYATGTGEKFFPIGTAGTYLPVTLHNVSGASPVVGMEAVQPNTNRNVASDLISVSPLRYWQLRVYAGSFTGSPVTLPVRDENFQSTENLTVAESKNIADPFHSLGQSSFSGSLSDGSIKSKTDVTLSILAVGEAKVDSDHALTIYNVVTPGNDLKHDFFKIVNIQYYPNNSVIIVNRWGDKVFEIQGYNNDDKVFNGEGNTGGLKALSDGTYYYVIDKNDGDKKLTGFLTLKR